MIRFFRLFFILLTPFLLFRCSFFVDFSLSFFLFAPMGQMSPWEHCIRGEFSQFPHSWVVMVRLGKLLDQLLFVVVIPRHFRVNIEAPMTRVQHPNSLIFGVVGVVDSTRAGLSRLVLGQVLVGPGLIPSIIECTRVESRGAPNPLLFADTVKDWFVVESGNIALPDTDIAIPCRLGPTGAAHPLIF